MEDNEPSLLELEIDVIGLRRQWEEARSGRAGLSEAERRDVLEAYIRGQARLHGRASEDQLRKAFPEAA